MEQLILVFGVVWWKASYKLVQQGTDAVVVD